MAAKPGSAGGAAPPPAAPAPPPVLEKKTLAESRFLRFVNVDYARPGDNAKSSWQYVERTTRRGDVDAVNIFAVLKKKDGNHQVLVVKQYRPPMGKHTIELPAGLVDKDESPQTAALRELKEETGYVGTFIGATGQQALSPGLTNENMCVTAGGGGNMTRMLPLSCCSWSCSRRRTLRSRRKRSCHSAAALRASFNWPALDSSCRLILVSHCSCGAAAGACAGKRACAHSVRDTGGRMLRL